VGQLRMGDWVRWASSSNQGRSAEDGGLGKVGSAEPEDMGLGKVGFIQ
jgi:hypothetical protein